MCDSAPVRTPVDGQIWISYSQAYLTSGGDEYPQLDVCFPGQVNGLLGAAVPGCLYLVTGLHTGWVPITVEVHDARPAVGPAWEEVVEASFRPEGTTVTLLGCMGDEPVEFDLAVVSYRARYCASGMDAARAADTRSEDEPESDRYLLQLWPAPPAPDEVLRRTSEIAEYWHGVARESPSPGAPASGREAQETVATEPWQVDHDTAVRGGVRPADLLGSVLVAAPVARLDLALAEQLVRLDPVRGRLIARWAARAALTEAGLGDVAWIAAGLAALEAGAPLPPPFDDPAAPVTWLFGDPRVPHTVVTTPDGAIDNLSQQTMALYALICAADPDPVRALFIAVQHAQLAFGRERVDVLHRAVRERLQAPG